MCQQSVDRSIRSVFQNDNIQQTVTYFNYSTIVSCHIIPNGILNTYKHFKYGSETFVNAAINVYCLSFSFFQVYIIKSNGTMTSVVFPVVSKLSYTNVLVLATFSFLKYIIFKHSDPVVSHVDCGP